MTLTDVFLKLLSMSLTASYCILLICAVRFFLRRVPKLFSYLLWSIVAVRLLCPVAFESKFSLLGESFLAFTGRIEAGSATGDTASYIYGGDSNRYGIAADVSDGSGSSRAAYSSTDLAGAGHGSTDSNITGGNTGFDATGRSSTDSSPRNVGAVNPVPGTPEVTPAGHAFDPDNPASPSTRCLPHTIVTIAAVIWLWGMLGLFVYCAFSCLRLHRSLARKATYSLHYKGIPVYEAAGLDTPFVAGFTKPAIYLPTGLEEWEACQCLAHEYTHIRRKDYLVKQSAFLLACVYWFQPMVWLAFHLMSRDMEMSCDEMTLRGADLTDRKAYSNALVRLSSEARLLPGYPPAFSEHNTASRVKNILNLKKPAFRILVTCSVILGVFAAGLLTDPPGSDTAFAAADSQDGSGLLFDPPLSPVSAPQASERKGNTQEELSDSPMEDPYPSLIQDACQELQNLCRQGETEKASELRMEMKGMMTSYWTYLVKEQQTLQNEFNTLVSTSHTTSFEEASAEMLEQLRLLEAGVNQAKLEMNYLDKLMDAIEGRARVVRAADYDTAYPLSGVLTADNTVVRSLPKESAPAVDILSAGDSVSVISFGKYMLLEDVNFRDFFLSDTEVQQEYRSFTVVLYHSEEEGRKTLRKGYIPTDSLDISGNTAETCMYWIGKTWSEAFCSQDGATLYQMAADKKAFAGWEYTDILQGTEDIQVEWNTSLPCAQSLYHVNLLSGEASGGQAASANDLALQYFVQTPDSTVWTQRQDLQITSSSRQLQGIRRVSDLLNPAVLFSEVRNYEQITGFLAYQDAYLTDQPFGPAYFDFSGSGYAKLYNPDSVTYLINQSMTDYMAELAETVSGKYLNLSGGTAQADTITMRLRDGDRISGMVQLACVEYTFDKADESGQDSISIPMYYDAANNCWCIWMPGQNSDIDSAMEKLQENLMQFAP